MLRISQKLEYLQKNYFGEWLKNRREVENQLSDKLPMFCLCGRLCTGLHEKYCRRFQNTVTKETVKKLAHLLPK